MLKPGIYRHFKGKEYELLDTVTHSETGETLVLYRALYGEHRLWVRPLALWEAEIQRDGFTGPRFQFIRSI